MRVKAENNTTKVIDPSAVTSTAAMNCRFYSLGVNLVGEFAKANRAKS
jgi:hypothetical protein